jgi:hypothetical protein
MMPCSATCACLEEKGLECLAVVNPQRFGYFRAWCALDPSSDLNRTKRRHVLARSRAAFSSADELRKVLAPIAGGAGGGCNCDCNVICVGCTSFALDGSFVAITGPVNWSGTVPTGTGATYCTPAAFAAGSYTVKLNHPSGASATKPATSGPADCSTITVHPALCGPPSSDGNLVDQHIPVNDAAPRTQVLTGIGAGPCNALPITVTATSNNPTLVANPTVTYTSPGATAQLSYSAIAGASGTAVITVTVKNALVAGEACNAAALVETFNVMVP